MALMKKNQSNDVAYWKVSGVNISYTGNVAQIFVLGFRSEEERQEGIENKVAFENYICKGEDFEKYFGIKTISTEGKNDLTGAYNYLKDKVEDFIGSSVI